MTTTINNQTYEKGVYQRTIERMENPRRKKYPAKKFEYPVGNPSDQLLLVTHHQENPDCKIKTPYDFSSKDAFFVSSLGGTRTVTVPNDLEQHHFNEFNMEHSKGWIFVCLYSWEVVSNIAVEVNGRAVQDYTNPFLKEETCRALKHDDTDESRALVWEPNLEGRYTIRVTVTSEEWTSVEISSIILM